MPKFAADLPVVERASRQSNFSQKFIFRSGEASPYVSTLPYRDLVVILAGHLELSAKEDNREETRRTAGVLARLVVLIGYDPSVEFTLVRMTGGMVAERALQAILNLHGQDTAYRKIVSDAATIMDIPIDLRPMLRQNYWEAFNYVQQALKPRQGVPGAPSSPARFIPSFERASMSRLDEYYAYAMANYPANLWDDQALWQYHLRLQSLQNLSDVSMTVVNSVTPGIEGLVKSICRYHAQIGTLLQAVRALDGADLNNGLPLQDRHRLDADGSPLRLRRTPDGWIIYSIGYNLTDDDGVFDSKKGKDDFAVRIPTR